jgi:DNA polymerase III epsilon subunit-like protein
MASPEVKRHEAVFLDIETGGLQVSDPIIQIAAVAVDLRDAFSEVASFEVKIKFDPNVCEPKALQINSYDKDVWASTARDERDAFSSFKRFLEAHATLERRSARSGRGFSLARVGGHNVLGFDLERVTGAFTRLQLYSPIFRQGVLDTLQGATWFFERHPELERPESFGLSSLCTHFAIPTEGAHDALVDVRMSIALAKRFLE